jgi:hypothetical protein
MSEKEVFLDIDLPFGKVVFYNVDEVGEWIEKELDFWKWPDNFNWNKLRECNPQPNLINSIHSPLGAIKTAVDRIKQNHDDKAHLRLVDELKNKIYGAYKTRDPNQPNKFELLHSSQSRAKYIHSLIETEPLRAACLAAYYMRVPNTNYSHPTVLDGVVVGILFELGLKGSCEAEKASLEQLRQDWNEERIKAQKINENNAETAKDWKTLTDNDQTQQQSAFHKFIEKSQADVDDFKKRISAEIALKGPVTYWQYKARDHIVKSRWFGGFTVFAFVLVGAFVFAATVYFAPNLTLNEIKLRHIGLLAVGATIGVWLIRILVRNYLSHVHLSQDAVERVAMMQTYLALLEEGKLEDKHRNLILQALFRPASTGIVKDDAAPPFMAEWLKRTTGTDTG